MLFFVGPQLPIHPSGDSSLTAGPHLEPLRSRLISSRRCSISFAAWFNTRQSSFHVGYTSLLRAICAAHARSSATVSAMTSPSWTLIRPIRSIAGAAAKAVLRLNQADNCSSCAKDALAFKSSGFNPEQLRALMPRQSYLHFECEAMSVM